MIPAGQLERNKAWKKTIIKLRKELRKIANLEKTFEAIFPSEHGWMPGEDDIRTVTEFLNWCYERGS